MKAKTIVLTAAFVCWALTGSIAHSAVVFSDDFSSGAQTAADWDNSQGRMSVVSEAYETTDGPSFDWVRAASGGNPLSLTTYQIDVDIDQSAFVEDPNSDSGPSEAGIIFAWDQVGTDPPDFWVVRHTAWSPANSLNTSRLEIHNSDFSIAVFGSVNPAFTFNQPWHLTVVVTPTGVTAAGTDINGRVIGVSLDAAIPVGTYGIYPGGRGNRYDDFTIDDDPELPPIPSGTIVFSDDFSNTGFTAADWNNSHGRMSVVSGAYETIDGPSFDWVTAEPGGIPLALTTYQIDVDIDQSAFVTNPNAGDPNNPVSTGPSEAGIIFAWDQVGTNPPDFWTVRHTAWDPADSLNTSRLEIYNNDFSVAVLGCGDAAFTFNQPWHLTVVVTPTGVSAVGTDSNGRTIKVSHDAVFPAGTAGIYPGGVGNRFDNFTIDSVPAPPPPPSGTGPNVFRDTFSNTEFTAGDWNNTQLLMDVINGAYENVGLLPSFNWVVARPGGCDSLALATYQIDVDIDQSAYGGSGVGESEAGIVFSWVRVDTDPPEFWTVRHQSWGGAPTGFSRLEIWFSDFENPTFGPTNSAFTFNIGYHLTVVVTPESVSAVATDINGEILTVERSLPSPEVFPVGTAGIYTGGVGNRYDNFTISDAPAMTVNSFFITETGASTDVDEDGLISDDYTIVLLDDPAKTVTVDLITDGQVDVDVSQLTFDSGNWDTPVTVTVTGVDDLIKEGPHTGTITHTVDCEDPGNPGGPCIDPDFDGLVFDIVVNVADNDVNIPLPWFEEFSGAEGSFDPDWSAYFKAGANSGESSNIFQGGWRIQGIGAPFDITQVTGLDLSNFIAGVTIKDTHGHQGIVFHALGDINYMTCEVGWDWDLTSGIYFTARRWGFQPWSDGQDHHQTGETIRMWVRVEGDTFWEAYAEVVGSEPLVWAYTSMNEAEIDAEAASNGGFYNNETHGVVGLINIYDQNGPFDDYSVGAAYFPNPPGSSVVIEETDGFTEVDEQGLTSDVYTVRLISSINDPNRTVTVTISPDGEVSTDISELIFTPSDWNDRQTVTVTAVQDADIEGSPHPSVITHTVSSNLPNLAGEPSWNDAPFGWPVNVLDNDEKTIIIRGESGGSTDVAEEDETSDTYQVKLGQVPSGQVTVNILTDADVSTDAAQLTFDIGDWFTWQTVTVTAQEDALSEGPEVSVISQQASGGSYDGISKDLSVNVADNEPYCGDGSHGFWIWDVNQDCYVDWYDFSILGVEWMGCTDPFFPGSCTPNP